MCSGAYLEMFDGMGTKKKKKKTSDWYLPSKNDSKVFYDWVPNSDKNCSDFVCKFLFPLTICDKVSSFLERYLNLKHDVLPDENNFRNFTRINNMNKDEKNKTYWL